jgi:hypothetical protein
LYDSKIKYQAINDDYLRHWEAIYRKVETDRYGVDVAIWEKSGDDDYVHASLYWRIALEKTPEGGVTSFVNKDGYPEIIDGTMPGEKILYPSTETHDWRYI